ncbi:tail assembly chaperone [Halalkalibacterium halodurans]|uniref:tail assembly chaperone n=1 Tax=Halalkalibacterium halodurans TaxID=86665 RepID=UPI002E227776|nr:tail assembly chaperone [Halalkalibacterium halodurans]MED4105506.1 tail assembly chaperone [Halalkalibacterium halodurans]MED4109288.1 tail assembly chaperone [Halalkalibacterium halodurans]MED4149698.1 tail assembly chaperone [Halalkalibacterium halodurans]
MEFKIGNKNYQLQFGVKFLREMDKAYQSNTEGIRFGLGMEQALIMLATENPLVIVDIIKAATAHEKSKPSTSEIEQAVEEYAVEHDGLNDLFEKIRDELGNSPWTKAKVAKMKKEMKNN